MRCTLGTAVSLVAAIFLAATFWPDVPAVPGPARAVAQQPAGAGEAPPQPKAQGKTSGAAAVEAKFEERKLPQLDFVETPLKDVLELLGDAYEVDFLIDHRALNELGVTSDTPVTLQVKRTSLTFRTALELVLEQIDPNLGYNVRDGLIYITKVVGKRTDDEIQVYNVRDLLQNLPMRAAGPGGLGAVGGLAPTSLGGEGAVRDRLAGLVWEEASGWRRRRLGIP